MSHFTVLVKIPKEKQTAVPSLEETIAELLAPYQENNNGDCPREFLEWNDEEDAYLKQYDEESVEQLKLADGTFKWPHDYHTPGQERRTFDRKPDRPTGCELVTVPFKELYWSFEHFMESYAGYKRRDPEKGRYGYWENPNRKWDWYQIGGRWRGLLIPKRGTRATYLGEGGTGHKLGLGGLKEDSTAEVGGVDALAYRDLDLEAMDATIDGKIEKFWAKVERVRGPKDKQEPFDEFDVRDTCWDLGLIDKDAEDKPLKPFTLEDLKRDHRAHWEFGTWAVLDEKGEWHEKGWFGMPDDHQRSYHEKFLNGTDPDTLLVIVDCHI